MKASENGYEECVKLLLEGGVNVNATCEESYTSLMYSAKKGREACLYALFAGGADVNAKEKTGSTAINISAARGHDKCVKYLIEVGAEVNNKNIIGQTALIEAAYKESFNCIEHLLEAGAAVSAKTKDVCTAILLASMPKVYLKSVSDKIALSKNYGRIRSIETLINGGVDVNIKDTSGNIPLHKVIEHGHDECVPLLLAAGAHVNTIDSRTILSALIIAIKKGTHGTVEQLDLLKAGADVNIMNNKGDTALTIAAAYSLRNDELVKRLLKANCRINKMDGMTQNALAAHLRGASSTNYVTWPLVAAGETLDSYRKIHHLLDFLTLDVRMRLKHICRETIRKHLLNLDPHSNLFGRVPQLGLPRVLTEYLLYDITLKPSRIFCNT